MDHIHHYIGVSYVPLAYIIRKSVDVPSEWPALAAGQPYSTEFNSIEVDLINRDPHTHGLLRDNSAEVYSNLEEYTRSNYYADLINPFERAKYGCDAFMSLTNQYADLNKREAKINNQYELLHTRTWKVQYNFTLERFIQQHRNVYISMKVCTEHSMHRLPNEHNRVGYFLDTIETSDALLLSAMEILRKTPRPL